MLCKRARPREAEAPRMTERIRSTLALLLILISWAPLGSGRWTANDERGRLEETPGMEYGGSLLPYRSSRSYQFFFRPTPCCLVRTCSGEALRYLRRVLNYPVAELCILGPGTLGSVPAIQGACLLQKVLRVCMPET